MSLMRPAEHLRSLVAYNAWANDKIVGAAQPLAEADLSADLGGYDTILGTLNHYLWAQVNWAVRLKGDANVERFKLAPSELWPEFTRADAELGDLAAGLADDDFERMLDYQDSAGNPHRRTIGQLITHVVNHGTYHRGEAGLMLTRSGRSPGDLDYVYFIPEGADPTGNNPRQQEAADHPGREYGNRRPRAAPEACGRSRSSRDHRRGR